MSYTIKNPSPLVEAVISLDTYLEEISRLGAKIETFNMNSDSDCEHAEKLMARFSECGESVTNEIARLSQALSEARAKAEAAGDLVAAKSELLQARKGGQIDKMERFKNLGEKVRELTVSLAGLSADGEPTEDQRAEMTARLAKVKTQLAPLIDEAKELKLDAQKSRSRTIEQGADALGQSLGALSRRLEAFQSM